MIGTCVNAPEECYVCHQMKPCALSINIMTAAAHSVPSIMKPICQDCAPIFAFNGVTSTTPVPSATGDWRDTRALIESIYPNYKDMAESERQVVWKIAENIGEKHPILFAKCVECNSQFKIRSMYRCTDCKAYMCEDHWRKHFGAGT